LTRPQNGLSAQHNKYVTGATPPPLIIGQGGRAVPGELSWVRGWLLWPSLPSWFAKAV
jgi:hypothetical protein